MGAVSLPICAVDEFRALSNPYEGNTRRTASLLASTVCTETLQLFMERFGVGLALGSDQCLALSSFFAPGNPFSHYWTPAIPTCLLSALNEKRLPPSSALLDLLVHATLLGIEGSFKVKLTGARRINWGDISVLLEGSVGILSQNGDKRLQNKEHCYPLLLDERKHFMLHEGNVICLLTQQNCPSWYTVDVPLVGQLEPRVIGYLSAALDLLFASAPEYYSWVTEIVKHIAIIDAPDERLHSCSSLLCWGAIAVSPCTSPLRTCEMLVHEASHQYFHLLSRLFPPVEQDAEFYSPLKNKLRPLSKLMLGYHAFANVYLFYRKCASVDALHTEVLGLLPQVASDLDAMSEPIADQSHWNDFARFVIAPLIHRTTPLAVRA